MNEEKIPDQMMVWNKKHANGEHASLRKGPSPLAEILEPMVEAGSQILELGCGVGRDSVFLEQLGCEVIATDASEVVITQNNEFYTDTTVQFQVLDMQRRLPFDDNKFDIVFANLSLHYYLDEKTREIFREVHRVLKPFGILAFACKSHDETRTLGAEEIEDHVFVAPSGHATHMFTTDYAKDLLDNRYKINHLDDVDEEYSGRVSGIVRCIAQKQ